MPHNEHVKRYEIQWQGPSSLGCRDRRYSKLMWICKREWPARWNEYAYILAKNGTDVALEQNPAFYNEKPLEIPTTKKLTNG